MKKNKLEKTWRKIDNTAKAFTMEEKKFTNTFRLSVILKELVDPEILKIAITKSLDMYPSYKVKIKNGFFWNYLKTNKNDLVLEAQENKNIKTINLSKNNDYLFKVTYINNKINLDMCHILTDGVGATIFLKSIIYNYLNFKYGLNTDSSELLIYNYIDKDQLIENADKSLVFKKSKNKTFFIREKINPFFTKTYHYILDLKNFKEICKKNNVSISEYLSALYVYAIYNTVYDRKSKKDILLTVPIDLRRRYNVDAFSNFFTCMDVKCNLLKNKYMNFKKILNEIKKEFQSNLNNENIQKYLARDVKLGTNFGISMVPLVVKKAFMKYFGKYVNNSPTTTFSNIGPIKIADQYKKYINNIVALVNTGKQQKVKCTICSYENNLTITINSNLISNKLEKEFYRLLLKHVGNVKLSGSIM